MSSRNAPPHSLRDDIKNGWVADYASSVSHETFTNQAKGMLLATKNRKWVLNKTLTQKRRPLQYKALDS